MLLMCYPQPTCYEEADANLEEALQTCLVDFWDPLEIEICQKEAKEIYSKAYEECDLQACEAEAHAVHAPKFEACDAITDAVERDNCSKEVRQSLEQAL